MYNLKCAACGRLWYSATPDVTEPCKCGGQLAVIETDDDEPLGAARGCLLGIFLGAVILGIGAACAACWYHFSK